jgi:hypothetical protein
MCFQRNISLILGRNGGSRHLKFIVVELTGGAKRSARGAWCHWAHHSHALCPATGPLRRHENWIWIRAGENAPRHCHHRWRGEVACCHSHHWGGREGIAAKSIGEEEAPPEGKERECCRQERNGHHGRRRNGTGCRCHRRDGEWHIGTPRRATAPRSRSREVERTLSFRLDNGGSKIRLETLLGCWAGAAAHEHNRPDDRMPWLDNFRFSIRGAPLYSLVSCYTIHLILFYLLLHWFF